MGLRSGSIVKVNTAHVTLKRNTGDGYIQVGGKHYNAWYLTNVFTSPIVKPRSLFERGRFLYLKPRTGAFSFNAMLMNDANNVYERGALFTLRKQVTESQSKVLEEVDVCLDTREWFNGITDPTVINKLRHIVEEELWSGCDVSTGLPYPFDYDEWASLIITVAQKQAETGNIAELLASTKKYQVTASTRATKLFTWMVEAHSTCPRCGDMMRIKGTETVSTKMFIKQAKRTITEHAAKKTGRAEQSARTRERINRSMRIAKAEVNAYNRAKIHEVMVITSECPCCGNTFKSIPSLKNRKEQITSSPVYVGNTWFHIEVLPDAIGI